MFIRHSQARSFQLPSFHAQMAASLQRQRTLPFHHHKPLSPGPVTGDSGRGPRLADFVVSSEEKRVEKLRYIHRNPVKRGSVLDPDQWEWSSFRWYAHGERGQVLVNEQRPTEMKMRERQTFPAQAVR
jgi:hypothetical protein